MPMTPAAAKRYKARRPEVTIDDVITPEIRAKRKAMMEAAADEAAGPAADNRSFGTAWLCSARGTTGLPAADAVLDRGAARDDGPHRSMARRALRVRLRVRQVC